MKQALETGPESLRRIFDWDFIVVSNELDTLAEEEASSPDRSVGLLHRGHNYEVWAPDGGSARRRRSSRCAARMAHLRTPEHVASQVDPINCSLAAKRARSLSWQSSSPRRAVAN